MSSLREDMAERERVANRRKHWVRVVTACNSRCLFCLDSDTPRNLYLPEDEVRAELDRGRVELEADRVILSGGEATLHPAFQNFIRYARDAGYSRVQTVTNGYMLADLPFYEACVAAGLGEITYSLHGHDEELHDRLTGTEGAFRRITKGIARTVRDERVICNVDIVINKQNVAVLDRVVELAISLGVREFDLMHVIPQAAAFENRDELFYDPANHIDVLRKVFSLNRHPGFVVWTNRFPVPFLEGLEDLVQDPHKMLDEVNGRRFQVRRYLDTGTELDCRQPERCVHCFIEPFCTSTDRTLARLRQERSEVWWVGTEPPAQSPAPLPFGCTRLGVEARSPAELPTDQPLYARVEEAEPPPAGQDLVLVADTATKLDAWMGRCALEIELNRDTAPWLLAHRARLESELERVTLHQPSWERMDQASESDVRDPAGFFLALNLPVRTSGLAACQAPGARLVEARAILRKDLFDPQSGRPGVQALAKQHVAEGYRVHSLRCRSCRVRERCDGISISMVRDQGLRLARPLGAGEWPDEAERQLLALRPQPLARVGKGAAPEPVVPSLPGFPPPAPAPDDPLAELAHRKQAERRSRRLALLGDS